MSLNGYHPQDGQLLYEDLWRWPYEAGPLEVPAGTLEVEPSDVAARGCPLGDLVGVGILGTKGMLLGPDTTTLDHCIMPLGYIHSHWI